MKRFLVRILSTLLLFITVFQMVEAQTMHVTLFINENEQPMPPDYVDRRPDRRADMNNMYEFFKTIANTIGYRYSCTRNSDQLFTSDQVMREMRRLQQPGVVGPNDIVVFYYGGHGYNDLSNEWPTFALLDYNKKKCRQTDVKNELDKIPNKPKLVLCIAGCCNSIHYPKGSGGTIEPLPIGSDPVAIKKLFTGFSGNKSIMVSSSRQGQVSYSLTGGPILGSIFGICLRRAIYRVDMYSDWNKVLEKARLETMDLTKEPTDFKDGQQQPQFEISAVGGGRSAVVKSVKLIPNEIHNGEKTLGIHMNLDASGYIGHKLNVSAYLYSEPGKSVKSLNSGGSYVTIKGEVGAGKNFTPNSDGLCFVDLFIPNNELYITSSGTYYVRVIVFDGGSKITNSGYNSVYLSLDKTPDLWYKEGRWYYDKEDYTNAVPCFRKAAEQGHIDAQYFLGVCYHWGLGVSKNDCEAEKLWRKLAVQGDPDGEYALGLCYKEGICVPMNYDQAVKWFQKSASQNHALAWRQLGWCYKNGEGVPQNLDEAKKCFRKAVDLGDEDSKEILKEYFSN